MNPLFEVFDGGDFILSSYRDVEEPLAEMRVYLDPAGGGAALVPAAKAALKAALDIVGVETPITVGEIADEDWQLAYRRHFKTEPIGEHLLSVPEWEVESAKAQWADSGRRMIVLDPGMAFGTGKHETTRACLEYLDEIVSAAGDPAGLSVLDMGSGSGILSIAAAKLGCGRVVGFDVDQEAVDASAENAAKNEVGVEYFRYALGRADAAKGDARLDRRYDLVLANILGPLLIRFADEIVPVVGSRLVLSGILSELYPEVRAAYVSRGLREVSSKTFGEWTTGLYEI